MQKLQSVYGMNKFKGVQNQYLEQSILTASPADLVTMLYEAAIKNIKYSIIAIENKNYELSNTHIKKSQEIVDELIKGLDLSYDLSSDILRLYEFILMELVDSNISKDNEKLKVTEDLLTEMYQTWKTAVTSSRMQRVSV